MEGAGAPSERTDETNERGRDLRVPPTRLTAPGSGTRPALAALLAVVGLIAVGIGAAQLLPAEAPSADRPPVSASHGATAATGATGSAAAPEESRAPMILPPRLTREALTAGVLDGSLSGQLVFIDGQLEAIPIACDQAAPGPHSDCVMLAVEGLGLPVTAGPSALPWSGGPTAGSMLVFVAERERLRYLGDLGRSPGGPSTLRSLTRRLLQERLSSPVGALFDVEGYLVINPVHSCYRRDPAATPCPAPEPFLADDPPTAEGILLSSRGSTVDLEPAVAGLDPSRIVTAGAFLVTLPPASACRPGEVGADCTADGVRWVVVARYDPDRSVRAVIP